MARDREVGVEGQGFMVVELDAERVVPNLSKLQAVFHQLNPRGRAHHISQV